MGRRPAGPGQPRRAERPRVGARHRNRSSRARGHVGFRHRGSLSPARGQRLDCAHAPRRGGRIHRTATRAPAPKADPGRRPAVARCVAVDRRAARCPRGLADARSSPSRCWTACAPRLRLPWTDTSRARSCTAERAASVSPRCSGSSRTSRRCEKRKPMRGLDEGTHRAVATAQLEDRVRKRWPAGALDVGLDRQIGIDGDTIACRARRASRPRRGRRAPATLRARSSTQLSKEVLPSSARAGLTSTMRSRAVRRAAAMDAGLPERRSTPARTKDRPFALGSWS